ncbi:MULTISPECIES: peptide methionine sulfoxide reductase [Winogradskyella]|uniref:Peptide methionine sulfoxide reductase n=1 Tax=Winogradskyella ouciana TaxID=2608631 RepID=A0A7K1GE77_9FLAO|nr:MULTISPECIES: peptide methionine sulfoxide reductase [Winogradskyella]MBO6879122.1 peptide methionine sulfoxide reductase [Winogradskyella sp.]MTE26734.1 peptide methionine sulfoxide reductase [Winogradskyella ouciana]
MLLEKIKNIPIGYSEVNYKDKTYGVTRNDFNNGKSIKIYAEELGGSDFISLNYYITNNNELLKPCEMSEQKVIHFLNNYMLSHEN